jgi:hypothetical protein
MPNQNETFEARMNALVKCEPEPMGSDEYGQSVDAFIEDAEPAIALAAEADRVIMTAKTLLSIRTEEVAKLKEAQPIIFSPSGPRVELWRQYEFCNRGQFDNDPWYPVRTGNLKAVKDEGLFPFIDELGIPWTFIRLPKGAESK